MTDVMSALTGRMNYLIARQGVVAGNIANADTPGYLAQDLQAEARESASPATSFGMALTNAKHMRTGTSVASDGGTRTTDRTFLQHNGNSVRLDQEMMKMSDIQLNYRTMTQLYAKQVNLQKIALGRGQ
jgi:flagellar basal-body rod protein FlgB